MTDLNTFPNDQRHEVPSADSAEGIRAQIKARIDDLIANPMGCLYPGIIKLIEEAPEGVEVSDLKERVESLEPELFLADALHAVEQLERSPRISHYQEARSRLRQARRYEDSIAGKIPVLREVNLFTLAQRVDVMKRAAFRHGAEVHFNYLERTPNFNNYSDAVEYVDKARSAGSNVADLKNKLAQYSYLAQAQSA